MKIEHLPIELGARPNGHEPSPFGLTDRERRRVRMLDQYRRGVPVKDIAEEHGITVRMVRETAWRYGVLREDRAYRAALRAKAAGERERRIAERKQERDARRVEKQQRVVQLYESGVRGDELARREGVTRERICQILRPTNIMATRIERARIAREALRADADKIKAEARNELDRKIAAAVAVVREGKSLLDAGRQTGLTVSQIHHRLSPACKAAGIVLQHGRHRDFGPRKQRVAELRAAGKTNGEIIAQIRSEGDCISANWLAVCCPHPDGRGGSRRNKDRARRAPPAPPVNPEAQWTDEKVALLRKQWVAGSTAQQIVDMLGGEFTRNAIIGKINRLRESGQLFQAGDSPAQ